MYKSLNFWHKGLNTITKNLSDEAIFFGKERKVSQIFPFWMLCCIFGKGIKPQGNKKKFFKNYNRYNKGPIWNQFLYSLSKQRERGEESRNSEGKREGSEKRRGRREEKREKRRRSKKREWEGWAREQEKYNLALNHGWSHVSQMYSNTCSKPQKNFILFLQLTTFTLQGLKSSPYQKTEGWHHNKCYIAEGAITFSASSKIHRKLLELKYPLDFCERVNINTRSFWRDSSNPRDWSK